MVYSFDHIFFKQLRDDSFLFQPDEVRKKGPRGIIELTDAWIAPSNEDDVTFSVQTNGGDAFKLRGRRRNLLMYNQLNCF